MTLAIDAHQHFWDTAKVPLAWLRPEHASIAGPRAPADLEPLLEAAGIDRTILVQSACSDADTGSMFDHAASCANVAAKISGLNTVLSKPDWNATDFEPAVRVAVDAFGPERLMCGRDWPVAPLNGDYGRVWAETRRALEAVASPDRNLMLSDTACRLYGPAEVSVGAH